MAGNATIAAGATPGQPRRAITLLIRPLEAFEEAIQGAPVLFDVAPAMAHHWALKLTDTDSASVCRDREMCFEIGIENDRIFAQDGIPWDALRGRFSWIERRIGYTMLSDEQIFHKAVLVIQNMGPEYKLFSANCQVFSRLLFESIRAPSGLGDLARGLQRVPKPVDVFLRRCHEAGMGGGSILVNSAVLLVAAGFTLHALRWAWAFPAATTSCSHLLLLVVLEGALSFSMSALHLLLSTLLYRLCSKQQSASGLVRAAVVISSSVLLVVGYAFHIETLLLRIRTLAVDDPRLAVLVPAWFITTGMGIASAFLSATVLFLDDATDNAWTVLAWVGSSAVCLAIYILTHYRSAWDPAVYPMSSEALERRAALGLRDSLWLLLVCVAFLLLGVGVCVGVFLSLHAGARKRCFDSIRNVFV